MDDADKTTGLVEARVDDALRHVARDALADDGLMVTHADHVLALLNERDRLRAALVEIERRSPKPGGVGQIARDTLRVIK